MSRPIVGADDPRAYRPMRGSPFVGADDPRRGPGVPRPDQLTGRPAQPRAARRTPAPYENYFGGHGSGSMRRDPVSNIPNTPEEDLDEYPGAAETVRKFTEMLMRDTKKRPAPVPPRRTEPPEVFIAPATNQVMTSDSPLEFSLPPVYMACSECAHERRKNEKGIYNQAGIHVRVWNAQTGEHIDESNMCRTHYHQFIRYAKVHPEYRYRYSRDLRPGI